MALPAKSPLFINRQDLVELGFSDYEASHLLRMAKANLVDAKSQGK